MTSQLSAKITLWCSRLLAVVICLLVVFFPSLLRWYQTLRSLGPYGAAAILIGFYCCVPAVLYALRCIDCLVVNILAGEVFAQENVSRIRRIRWCCAWVYLEKRLLVLLRPESTTSYTEMGNCLSRELYCGR